MTWSCACTTAWPTFAIWSFQGVPPAPSTGAAPNSPPSSPATAWWACPIRRRPSNRHERNARLLPLRGHGFAGFDRLAGALEDVGRAGHDPLDQGLDVFAAHEIGLQVLLPGIGEIVRIPKNG